MKLLLSIVFGIIATLADGEADANINIDIDEAVKEQVVEKVVESIAGVPEATGGLHPLVIVLLTFITTTVLLVGGTIGVLYLFGTSTILPYILENYAKDYLLEYGKNAAKDAAKDLVTDNLKDLAGSETVEKITQITQVTQVSGDKKEIAEDLAKATGIDVDAGDLKKLKNIF